MSDSDERQSIREKKAEAIKQQLASSDEPIHVDGPDHFEEETASGVVLVDFYADWCGPCKMIEPVVESIAAETDATVLKVDVDAQQALAGQYNVQGVPTMFLYVDGEQVERLVGAQDESTLRSLVESHT